jgi:hypothetical protein
LYSTRQPRLRYNDRTIRMNGCTGFPWRKFLVKRVLGGPRRALGGNCGERREFSSLYGKAASRLSQKKL